jgi:hypothetical protein
LEESKGLGLGLAAMTASQAMPLAPLDRAASANTIHVAGGCGPGWHRGPYGGCRPMFNCPPGWHSGPLRPPVLPQLVSF